MNWRLPLLSYPILSPKSSGCWPPVQPLPGARPSRRGNLNAQTIVGGKWLGFVVKYGEDDAFVVKAYLTDKPKNGEDLWLKK